MLQKFLFLVKEFQNVNNVAFSPNIYPYMCNVVEELSCEIPSLALIFRLSLVSRAWRNSGRNKHVCDHKRSSI